MLQCDTILHVIATSATVEIRYYDDRSDRCEMSPSSSNFVLRFDFIARVSTKSKSFEWKSEAQIARENQPSE